MLGVLVVKDADGKVGFLSGFSGIAGGRSIIDGFVPPIYDLTIPDGHYKTLEKEISNINETIRSLELSPELSSVRSQLESDQKAAENEINAMKVSITLSRQKRDAIRQQSLSAEEERKLILESQHEKASLHRLKKQWQERIDSLKNSEKEFCGQIAMFRAKRRAMSDELQKWAPTSSRRWTARSWMPALTTVTRLSMTPRATTASSVCGSRAQSQPHASPRPRTLATAQR